MRVSDYPFTEEAAERVRGCGYSLESLLCKTSFKTVRGRAAERVAGAIAGGIADSAARTDAELLAELLSYPLARVMVSCLGDPILLRRYALAEAKLAYRHMQEEKDGVAALAEDLGLHPQMAGAGGTWRIHFSEYIRAAHGMKSAKWKLVNRDLAGGYLTVTEEELKRLLEEAARERVLKGLPLPVDERICASLQEYLGPLRADLERLAARQRVDLGRVEEGAFPPCIRKMLADVAKGANLAHSARFALVSFLLQINMSPEQIISIFNTSPDFDAERTRYQVEHIAGATGTRYRPPACATMATYGNCPGEDELCRGVRHPLSYYERRIKMAGLKPLPAEQKEGT
ncbi:MAG TPA: DNA primase large subunit PriL [Methanothrix sp.]|nr:DNA primase large subunit PriL [Methanothrix sp.]HPC89966.1 DNA primase large subunit PriL [Methanothrix sp.]HQE87525.1 DNA primase large subunit PriL [Methanothrix sp.]HQI68183.1 DNA primase large subunit PriL [Methanothrix sp.]HRS84957.1 DNA primase large subunit PriL [Methanothrix sp.]